MKTIILFASIAFASGLLFVNIYTSIVDATSWGSKLPESIDTARNYFKVVNPGNFFRIFSPVSQVLAILTLVLFWKTAPGIRPYLSIACLMYISAEAFTFLYFYPRNAILFETAKLTDIDLLRKTWSQWNTMNWFRSLLILIGLICSFVSLYKIAFGNKL